MGDGEHAQAAVLGLCFHAPSDVPQCVDVEAGVDLVEDGDLGLEHGELERLGALLLTPGELDVDAAGQELLADGETLRLARQPVPQPVRLPAPTADGGGEEV